MKYLQLMIYVYWRKALNIYRKSKEENKEAGYEETRESKEANKCIYIEHDTGQVVKLKIDNLYKK